VLQPWRGYHVAQLSRELDISAQHLRRRCVAALGYGPKQLQRILRFQAFLAAVQGGAAGEQRLAEIAGRVGYADQAHLTRECQSLAGLPPKQFLAETAAGCGPNHDHDVSFAALRAAMVRFVQDGAAHGS
jgi:AraC-like DNA-binding protein